MLLHHRTLELKIFVFFTRTLSYRHLELIDFDNLVAYLLQLHDICLLRFIILSITYDI